MSAIHGVNYGTPTLDLNFAKNKSLIDTVSGLNLVTFTRASTGTYVGADGLIKTAVANEARFDHNPVTGECLGLLVEEARTNYIVNSSVFTNSGFWQGNQGITISPNQITTPDNTLNGTLIQQDTSTSLHQLSKGTFGQQLFTTSSQYTISVFVKRFNANRITLCESHHYDLGGYTKAGLVWDFSTESIARTFQWSDSGQSRIAGTSIAKYSNGWYRISLSVTPGGDGNNQHVFPALVIGDSGDPNGGGRSAFVGNGVDGVYIWGFQTEIGSFPTSYIPTTGSTVTRSADVASITGTNFSRWYNQSEGTAYVEAKNIKSADYSQASFIGFDGSGGLWNNVQEWGLIYYDSSNTFSTKVFDSSGGPYQITNSGDRRSSAKVAVTLNTTSLTLSVNGNINSVTRTGGTMPSINSLLWHQNNNPNQSTQFTRFTYYPTRLQDFQLRQLTK